MTEDTSAPANGRVAKISNTWGSLLGTFKVRNRIHPSELSSPRDCEFIFIDSNIRIRVLHVTPERSRKSHPINQDVLPKRSSCTEEYWFTRNKPLRNVNCNCSFRRSLRHSVILNEPSARQRLLSIDAPPTKIKNLDSLVERLIQETFFEAFQEYFLNHTKTSIDNLGCDLTGDDALVTIRKKNGLTAKGQSCESTIQTLPNTVMLKDKTQCHHKKKGQKPLIILLHGLGSTADVWRKMLHNFSFNGYEVVAPDMLGHGYSCAPNKAYLYTFKNLLLQTIAIFDYFMQNDENRRCILVGHSYGCSLITALYPHRAPKIAQLVLISGGGPTPLAPPADSNGMSSYGWVHNLFYPLLYCGVKRSFFFSSRGKHIQSCEKETTVPPHIMDFLINGQYWPEGDAAFHRRIMVPTLLIHGLQDKNVTLVQQCEMERTIPRAYLEILPNAGHMSLVECPEHLTHMILCFLEMWS